MPEKTLAEFAATFDRASLQPRLEEAEQQRRMIEDKFPREGLRTLEMARYADDSEDRSTLAWLLAKGTPALGDISGVAFRAIGIHKLKGSGLYRSTLTDVGDAAADWENLREGLAQCCDLVLLQQWEAINNVPHARDIPSLRTKLLFVYFPNDVLPIYTSTEVEQCLEALGVSKVEGEGKWSAVHNRTLLEHLRSMPEISGWSTYELAQLLTAYTSKVSLRKPKVTNMERIINAMIEMRIADPSSNEWVSPDAVERHMNDAGEWPVGDMPTEMADMLTQAHHRPGRKPNKSPKWWVLEENSGKGLFRLSDEAWKIWHRGRASLPQFQVSHLPIMPPPALNQILYGPPGTGKTYGVIREAATIVAGQSFPDDHEAKAAYDRASADGQVRLATFHQSFSYEDFIEGIRPVMGEGGDARFQVRDGVFKEMATEALFACLERVSLPNTSTADAAQGSAATIPRRPGLNTITGRVWAIADELSTTEVPATRRAVLEKTLAEGINSHTAHTQYGHWSKAKGLTKRRIARHHISGNGDTGDDEQDFVKTNVQNYLELGPVSGWQLRADKDYPPYVLIIDEINRGNISRIFGELITLIEDDKREGGANALRVTLPSSRETFTVPPNLFLLGTMNTADKSLALLDVALRRRFEFRELAPDFSVCSLPPDMRSVLERINERIELRKDRDHRIGHAFFMSIRDVAGFNRAFVRKVVPLLQEYFFNDIDGARFVLGEIEREGEAGFLRQITTAPSEAKYQRNRWRWFTDEDPDMDCWARLWDTLGGEIR